MIKKREKGKRGMGEKRWERRMRKGNWIKRKGKWWKKGESKVWIMRMIKRKIGKRRIWQRRIHMDREKENMAKENTWIEKRRIWQRRIHGSRKGEYGKGEYMDREKEKGKFGNSE